MTSPRPRAHCRLFVILARKAPIGVIFRRGPAKWTQLITWNTRSDTFHGGQWFHGDIYERRCDLSPSGSKLIYFAAKHHRVSAGLSDTARSSYTSTWTAISTPPYFTALALWPNGGTTYHGGGLFVSETTVSVNALMNRWSPEAPTAHPMHTPPGQVKIEPIHFAWADQLLPLRLVRDGWSLTTPGDVHANMSVPSGSLVRAVGTRRLQLDFAFPKLRYTLVGEWADWDHQGRLVFARDGKLFGARSAQASGKRDVDVIADFDDARVSRLKAPPAACRW